MAPRKDEGSLRPLSKVREDIPLLERLTYLNSASCSPVPRPIVEAMSDYYITAPVNYRSGGTPIEQEVTGRIDAVRTRLAAHIGGASPREVTFTKNTTEAINLVASGLNWFPGDEIIVTPIEHQSNLIPWMRLSREAGVQLRYVQPGPDGRIDPSDLRDVISSRTRMVAIHHVSNVLGTIQDVAALADVVRATNALLLVDAAQSEGRIPLHVRTLGCDFLASCARKGLMGPQGIGFLWAKGELLGSLRTLSIGGIGAEAIDAHSYRELDSPFCHESGILNTAGAIGLGAAIDYAEAVRTEEAREYVTKLTTYLINELDEIDEIDIYGPTSPGLQAGIISWTIRDWNPTRLAERLYEQCRIVVAAGTCGSPLATRFIGVEGVVRSSVHQFNNMEDIDELVTALRTIIRDGS